MLNNLFSSPDFIEAMEILREEFPLAIWETLYVTVVSTALAIVLGLPLGVLLVAGEKGGVLPLPGWIMKTLGVIINLLRSVPFLILMMVVFPLTRLIVGTAVGTVASIVPLTIAAFPFIARLVESSLREVNPNIIDFATIKDSAGTSSKAVESTDGIVKAIENASTQLTLIGFNASIEAKRAGAAGAGFNVIAQEVRTLADILKGRLPKNPLYTWTQKEILAKLDETRKGFINYKMKQAFPWTA